MWRGMIAAAVLLFARLIPGQTISQAPRAASGSNSAAPVRGDSIVALTSRLIAGGALEGKDESETSEHFKARMDALAEANSKPMLLIKQSDDGEFSYDPKSSKLHMTLHPIARKIHSDDDKSLAAFVLAENLASDDSGVESNASGAGKEMLSTIYNRYEIAMAGNSGYDFPEKVIGDYRIGDFDLLEWDVAMPASRARSLKPYLRFAFYGQLSDGRVLRNSTSKTATVTSPYKTEIRSLTVIFRIDEIRVIDSRTGATVADATAALNAIER